MSGRILQFGTSRFLQAHAAFFVHEAMESGQDVGQITVVQTSNSAERSGRVAAFGNPEGYPVVIRGLSNGETIDRRVQVKSVERGLSARSDWQALSELFCDADFVISNTADSGYETFPEEDFFVGPADVPKSFPAKLAALLFLRWQASARPLVILPCELITRNGEVLKAAVRQSAEANNLPAGFLAWLDQEVAFADTLVDRIVSEPIEPVGAIAEPYALWAIKKAKGVVVPCRHEAIVLVDDLEPYERLKLHILNLGHTVLADRWLSMGADPEATVRAMLDDKETLNYLTAIYDNEVLSGFDARGMGDAARDYVATTLERFRNPFLNHRLADISQHHRTKAVRRIQAFIEWAGLPANTTPQLNGVLERSQR